MIGVERWKEGWVSKFNYQSQKIFPDKKLCPSQCSWLSVTPLCDISESRFLEKWHKASYVPPGPATNHNKPASSLICKSCGRPRLQQRDSSIRSFLLVLRDNLLRASFLSRPISISCSVILSLQKLTALTTGQMDWHANNSFLITEELGRLHETAGKTCSDGCSREVFLSNFALLSRNSEMCWCGYWTWRGESWGRGWWGEGKPESERGDCRSRVPWNVNRSIGTVRRHDDRKDGCFRCTCSYLEDSGSFEVDREMGKKTDMFTVCVCQSMREVEMLIQM